MAKKTLSAAYVEEIYGIPSQTLANWRWAGEGPIYVKIGKRVYYRERDIEEYMDSHEVRAKNKKKPLRD